MHRDPGDHGPTEGPEAPQEDAWAARVERREPITLNAMQVDQMLAALGQCVSAVYSIIDVLECGDDSLNKRSYMKNVYEAVDEAANLLDLLAKDVTK